MGCQPLVDDTEIMYGISDRYVPGSERGVHRLDPSLAIGWPRPVPVILERDSLLPCLDAEV